MILSYRKISVFFSSLLPGGLIRPDYSMDAVDHLFIGDAVFVRDAKESAKASHLGCLYPPFNFC